MEKAPALDPMPLYESCMVTFYRGAPAPGAPVVPTPLCSACSGHICKVNSCRTGCQFSVFLASSLFHLSFDVSSDAFSL